MEKETSTLKQVMILAKWKHSVLNDEEGKGGDYKVLHSLLNVKAQQRHDPWWQELQTGR